MVQLPWEIVGQILKKLNIYLTYNPAAILLAFIPDK